MSAKIPHTDEPAFEFSGGRLCLDLANTVQRRGTPRACDLLAGLAELVAWGLQGGVYTREQAGKALQASRRPAGAAALGRLRRLREAIFRVFSALAAGGSPEDEDLDLLSRSAGRTLVDARLSESDGRFSWRWHGDPASCDRLIWECSMSAVELLTSSELGRLRECAAGDCSWLFLDGSRNQSRRWCDMKVCGNRSKVRRHYLRHAESK